MNEGIEDSDPEVSEMEEQCAVLERVAAKFVRPSVEVAALRRAALALTFTILRHSQEFHKYIDAIHQPLSPEEEEKIRGLESSAE